MKRIARQFGPSGFRNDPFPVPRRFPARLGGAFILLLLILANPAQLLAQKEMPSTPFEAIAWLEKGRNTVRKNDAGEVIEIIIDYVPDVFVVGDLDIFPKLEVLKINYTGQFYDRHMSGIARLTSLKKFIVDYCDEISEASLSVLRYLPNLEEIKLRNCEAVYSLKSLVDCRSLKRIDLASNEHLDFHALKSLQSLPNLEALVLDSNSTLEDKHLRWLGDMPNLVEIRISDCSSVTDDGIKHFSRLKKLKVLDVSGNANLTGETLSELPGNSLEELYLNDCGITDASMASLAHFKSLKKIRIQGNRDVKGVGLSVFGNFRQLEELVLFQRNVTNEQLRALDGIETLKRISLNKCSRVSGLGLSALTKSTQVEQLDLSECRRIDCEDLVHICKFKNLKRLDLSGTTIKPDGLKQLKNLKKLEQLDLSKCNWVDDNAIRTISEFPKLNWLTLSRVPRLTDASLEHLARLESLERLYLEENRNITGAGFSAFPDTSRLTHLELKRLEKLSVKGLKNLQRFRSLEDLTIYLKKFPNGHLQALMGMPYLKSIDLDGEVGFDYEFYNQLRSTLPELDRDND